jgi:hypothetical protein
MSAAPDAKKRFRTAVLGLAHASLVQHGYVKVASADIDRVAAEQSADEPVVRLVLKQLNDDGWLRQETAITYGGSIVAAWEYEFRTEEGRTASYPLNPLRREILKMAADASDAGDPVLFYSKQGEKFIDRPYAEVDPAVRILEFLRCIEVQWRAGAFHLEITNRGHEVVNDTAELARLLPTSAGGDTVRTSRVAPDVLFSVIRDVRDLTRRREWASVDTELDEGDRHYRNGEWASAVGSYYAALENALRHALDDIGKTAPGGSSLKDLTKAAVREALVPNNYQALLDFADGIRSPRSHGRGPRSGAPPPVVEIQQPEALLMGNHVRSLTIYLGQRTPPR